MFRTGRCWCLAALVVVFPLGDVSARSVGRSAEDRASSTLTVALPQQVDSLNPFVGISAPAVQLSGWFLTG
jgi:hypothetical protein